MNNAKNQVQTSFGDKEITSSTDKLKTTVFSEVSRYFNTGTVYRIYNNGIYFRTVHGDGELLSLIRRNKIDMLYDEYQTNYNFITSNLYPEKLSDLFEWCKKNKKVAYLQKIDIDFEAL